MKATRPEGGDRSSGLWSGNWYRVRAAECLEFALTITTNAMFGIETPMGRTPFQGGSVDVPHPGLKRLGYSVRPLRGHRKNAQTPEGGAQPNCRAATKLPPSDAARPPRERSGQCRGRTIQS